MISRLINHPGGDVAGLAPQVIRSLVRNVDGFPAGMIRGSNNFSKPPWRQAEREPGSPRHGKVCLPIWNGLQRCQLGNRVATMPHKGHRMCEFRWRFARDQVLQHKTGGLVDNCFDGFAGHHS